MGGHETDPLQSRNLIDLSQKLRKCHRMLQILTIGVDILAKQHDFHHAVSHQALDLCDNVLRLSAALPSSYIRNDAVAAEVVAAKHDVDAGFKAVFPLSRQILHYPVGVFPNVHHHFFLLKPHAQ